MVLHDEPEMGSRIVSVVVQLLCEQWSRLDGPLSPVHLVCEKTTFVLFVSPLHRFGPQVVLARRILAFCLTE
jgi:hypothetical protein